MKILPVLLIASLAANAALLVPLVRRESAASATAAARAVDSSTTGGRSTGQTQSTRSSGPATGEGSAIAEAVKRDDLDALRDELRAAGIPDDTVRAIISARIWKRYESRFKALQTQKSPQAEWWKNDNGWGNQSKEMREQMRAIQAELKAENLRVLGPDPSNPEGNNPWMERQYGYLPAAKREALQKIEQDYNDLNSELRQESQGFEIAADREKARFLAEEKRRDLAEVLSPEELRAYDMRQSSTASQLRWRMTQMDATEQEYVAVFELQKKFDDTFKNSDSYGGRSRDESPEDRKLRQEGEKALRAEIKAALGEERYQAYILSDNHDFRQIQAAVKRFNLPPDTATRTMALRKDVPAAANRVLDNPDLSIDEKKAALAKLATGARDQVRATMGSDVAEALFSNGSMNWIQNLEQGTVVSFNEDGGQNYRSVNEARPKPKKKP